MEHKTSSIDTNASTIDVSITPEYTSLIDSSNNEILTLVTESIMKQLPLNESINKQHLFQLLIIGMETVEKSKMKGTNQKDLVIQALVSILKLESVQVTNQEQLVHFLENDASNIIDIIVDASKGKLNINKTESYVNYIIKLLFSCLKRNN